MVSFLLSLFLIAVIAYLFFINLPRILHYFLRKTMQNAEKRGASAQASDRQRSGFRSQSRKEKNSSDGGKMEMQDIARKKFEKDQGEYVDFYEEKY